MLVRGDKPLTPDERAEYEIGRELRRLRDAGLVMETGGSAGDRTWGLTLRGVRHVNAAPIEVRMSSGKRMRLTVEVLDSSC
jgi:hypothetical protein